MKKNILVVDDDAEIAMIIEEILKANHCHDPFAWVAKFARSLARRRQNAWGNWPFHAGTPLASPRVCRPIENPRTSHLDWWTRQLWRHRSPKSKRRTRNGNVRRNVAQRRAGERRNGKLKRRRLAKSRACRFAVIPAERSLRSPTNLLRSRCRSSPPLGSRSFCGPCVGCSSHRRAA